MIKEVAYVINGEKPNSIPIAPNIIPKGITGINKGAISIDPVLKMESLEDILKIY